MYKEKMEREVEYQSREGESRWQNTSHLFFSNLKFKLFGNYDFCCG